LGFPALIQQPAVCVNAAPGRAAKLTIKAGYHYFALEATQTGVKTVDDELIPRSYARIKMHNEPGGGAYDAHMVISNLPE
jgi:hypothetical protein